LYRETAGANCTFYAKREELKVPEHAQVIRVAKYRPDPGARDELLARMQQLATALRDVPGVFGAQVCRVAEAHEWLAIVSRWQDEDSMRNIVGTPAASLVDRVAGMADEEEIENLVSV
jgi:heme-degrading monooxygenase HmoA